MFMAVFWYWFNKWFIEYYLPAPYL
jgi:hypothetical protein